jgi:hypothetical protein
VSDDADVAAVVHPRQGAAIRIVDAASVTGGDGQARRATVAAGELARIEPEHRQHHQDGTAARDAI